MNEIDYSEEVWKDVIGWEGFYQVSDFGRIRSLSRNRGNILKPSLTKSGYHNVTLYAPERRKTRRVHFFVAEAFICPRPIGKQVNHKDGKKTRNVPNNLEWMTHRENCDHAIANGLWANKVKRGSANGLAKLTEAQVMEIRARRLAGERPYVLSQEFGIRPSTIRKIFKREVWTHI